MKIKVKLDPWGRIPTKAHKHDAGFDIYAAIPATIPAHGTVMINTGVHIELQPWTVGFIKNRSSMFKMGILTDGTIDCGYTGEIGVTLHNITDADYRVEYGDRIAQLVIQKILPVTEFIEVDSLEKTERGAGGFGSSGK